MKLRLNLATKPLENKRPFLALTGTLGALGILLLLLLSHGAFKSWRANRDLRLEIAHREAEIQSYNAEASGLAGLFSFAAGAASFGSGCLPEFADRRTQLSLD